MTAGAPTTSNRASRERVEPQNKKAAFPRTARLLRHADFDRVYKLGRRHFSASMTVFYLQRQEIAGAVSVSGPRVGFTVGRALGGAVDRNRMKRRLREAVRLCGLPLAVNGDVVINPKKVLLRTDFAQIVDEVRRAFEVVEQKLAGNKPVGNRESQPRSGGMR